MLVLSRKSGERIRIGDNIFITVIKVSGKSIKIGIDAPPEIQIVRDELPSHSVQPKNRVRCLEHVA
ncbi:MAG: carbon storage regulator [Blastopirellula sp.]|nr:MAG: carbon storage regulator [Blastopirellula sp.]